MCTLSAALCRPANSSCLPVMDHWQLTLSRRFDGFYDHSGLPPSSPFEHQLGTCAVVSSSDWMTGKGLGGMIDSNDAVFRSNAAPTVGFEGDVGSRTTVRIQSPIYVGFREGNESLVSKTWFLNGPTSEARRSPSMELSDPMDRFLSLKMTTDHGVHPANPNLVRAINRCFSNWSSTGYITLVVAANACRNVTAFGFGVSDSYYGWYYEKYPELPVHLWGHYNGFVVTTKHDTQPKDDGTSEAASEKPCIKSIRDTGTIIFVP